jgi:hypothetical protein
LNQRHGRFGKLPCLQQKIKTDGSKIVEVVDLILNLLSYSIRFKILRVNAFTFPESDRHKTILKSSRWYFQNQSIVRSRSKIIFQNKISVEAPVAAATLAVPPIPLQFYVLKTGRSQRIHTALELELLLRLPQKDLVSVQRCAEDMKKLSISNDQRHFSPSSTACQEG